MPRSSTSAPIASRSTRGPLHMIGNAHIDAVWLWPWQEGYQEARATYAAALDRIAEYPDFVFSSDSVAYFAWIEEHDPSLFERLREQVRAGRFEIVGGWWVEPDCNIPGGESFARHALYSQRYLCDRFGIPATIGCNVDPFGQNATMPQLLAKSGMDSYVFMRPQLQEKELPGPTFWWTAADGSRVLAYRIPHEYCSPGGHLGMYVGKVLAQLPHTKAPLMAFYGVGNHGGGPTRANIDSIHDLGARDQFPRMKLSTMREFFDDARHDSALPSYTGEIQPHAVGCYSAHSGIKAWLRHAENALQAAEKWASIAAVVSGIPSAHDEIEHAWKQVLLNQFHDTAAGTALSSAYGDAREQIGEAKAIAARVQNRALQSISCRIGVPAEDHTTPLVAFNVHPWPVRGVVEFEYGTALGTGPIVAEDDEGKVFDVQVAPSVTVTGGRRRLLVGVDLPALGYRLYRLRPALGGGSLTMPGVGPDRPVVATEPVVLENAHLRAVVDPATGWLSSLSTSEGPELIPPGAAGHAVVLEDLTDTWGHGVVSYRDVIGAFRASSVRVIESGPVRTTVRVKSAYRSSTLTEDILLDHDAPHLEVRVTLDWHEHLTMLKLRFPTALSEVTATHAIPYGHVIRPADGHEAPSQAWVDVSGVVGKSPAGLSVLDDAKCGVDVSGGDIGMTVVRSPAFAWHEPQPLPADGDFEVMDQGVQRFTYRLLPHSGDWRGAWTPRAAAELNQPLVPVIESAHGGPLGPRAQYAQVRGAQNVLLGVVKPASDGSRRTVVRGYETAGHSAHAVIDLPFLGRTIELAVAPAEIFTLLVPHDLEQPVLVTDLLEGLVAPPAELPSPG